MSTTFRKKPVVINAVQFLNSEYAEALAFNDVPVWLKEAIDAGTIRGVFKGEDYWYLEIQTLEGGMTASPGDWIIRGVEGEIYPCKPGIFAKTYEPNGTHGNTPHGHPCCPLADRTPAAAVSRCGGPRMCRTCMRAAAGMHGTKGEDL